MIGNPLRRESSWSVPIAVPRSQLIGTDGSSWFTTRPRSAQIAFFGVLLAAALGWVAIRDPLYALAIGAGVALMVCVVIRPLYGALGLVALVPALSGAIPGVPVPNIRISELLIGAIGVTLLVVARRSATAKWGALDWALLGYGILWTFDGIFGAVAAHEQLSVSSWGTVAGQLQFFLLYRSLKVTLHTSEERHLALRVLFVAGGVVALLAVLQEVHAPGVISFINTLTGSGAAGGVGGFIRATGPFSNWAALAGYLMPLVLIALCLGLGNAVRSHFKAQYFLALLLTLALFFTSELSVIACLLIGACILGLRYGRRREMMRWLGIGLLVVVVGAGGLLAHRLNTQFTTSAGTGRSPFIPQTLGFRWMIWTQQYIPAVMKRPLTGYGVVLPNSIQWPFPESQYITFLIQGGAPLLAMFGFLFWAMTQQAKRAIRSLDPVDRALGEGLLAATVILAIVNVVWPFLSNGGSPQLLWCLFAILPPVANRSNPTLSPLSLGSEEGVGVS
jgi:hypothetical protein